MDDMEGQLLSKAKRIKMKLVWVEKDGTPIPISAMSDHHLKCAIEMVQNSIKQRRYWRTDQLPLLKEERHYRALINKKGVRTCQHRSKNITKMKTNETC